jgi:hypothetical protein
MNVLNRIKLKISRGEYSFSDHSIYDKLEICGFTTEDLLNAVSTCKTVIKQTNTRAERDMLYSVTLSAANQSKLFVVFIMKRFIL